MNQTNVTLDCNPSAISIVIQNLLNTRQHINEQSLSL